MHITNSQLLIKKYVSPLTTLLALNMQVSGPENPEKEVTCTQRSTNAEDESMGTSHQKLLPTQYGDNPFTLGKRRRAVAGVWLFIKHLKDLSLLKTPNAKNQLPTHVCLMCWALIRMSSDKQKGCFLTTEALSHIRDKHPGHSTGIKSEGEFTKSKRMLVGGMLKAGLETPTGLLTSGLIFKGAASQKSLDHFHVPSSTLALSKAARFYVYGKTMVSKSTFEDPEFRSVLKSPSRHDLCLRKFFT